MSRAWRSLTPTKRATKGTASRMSRRDSSRCASGRPSRNRSSPEKVTATGAPSASRSGAASPSRREFGRTTRSNRSPAKVSQSPRTARSAGPFAPRRVVTVSGPSFAGSVEADLRAESRRSAFEVKRRSSAPIRPSLGAACCR